MWKCVANVHKGWNVQNVQNVQSKTNIKWLKMLPDVKIFDFFTFNSAIRMCNFTRMRTLDIINCEYSFYKQTSDIRNHIMWFKIYIVHRIDFLGSPET